MKVLTLSRASDWRLAALLVVAAAASVAPAVGVAAPGTTTSVTIDYTDLNTSTEAGAQALYRRIRAAARDVCGRPEFRSFELTRLRNECVDEAIAAAVAGVNRPQLSAVHQKVVSRTRS
jgi:UrcA family protein